MPRRTKKARLCAHDGHKYEYGVLRKIDVPLADKKVLLDIERYLANSNSVQ